MTINESSNTELTNDYDTRFQGNENLRSTNRLTNELKFSIYHRLNDIPTIMCDRILDHVKDEHLVFKYARADTKFVRSAINRFRRYHPNPFDIKYSEIQLHSAYFKILSKHEIPPNVTKIKLIKFEPKTKKGMALTRINPILKIFRGIKDIEVDNTSLIIKSLKTDSLNNLPFYTAFIKRIFMNYTRIKRIRIFESTQSSDFSIPFLSTFERYGRNEIKMETTNGSGSMKLDTAQDDQYMMARAWCFGGR